ncbi:hypothetical protein BGZ47_003074, partial [Haplosporangium gracile]
MNRCTTVDGARQTEESYDRYQNHRAHRHKEDPTQLQFLDNIITRLNYKNCRDTKLNTNIWPCGGCYKLPTNLKPGNVVMQWRWKLNSNE